MDLEFDLPFPLEPDFAGQHADLVVQAAQDIAELELDFSTASLDDVDAVIEGFRQDGISTQEVAELLFGFGCYVGEVIRRRLGGFWLAEQDLPDKDRDAAGWMVLAFSDDAWCNPIGKVFNRFLAADEDSLPNFYEMLLAKRPGT